MVILGTMIHGTMTTSSKKDYLSILGLSPDFDYKELKKAFRREARKWHPDLNKNDLNAEERFKLINEAYEYLRDPNIRKNSSDKNISAKMFDNLGGKNMNLFGSPDKIYSSGLDRRVREGFNLISSNFRPNPTP